MKISSQKNNIDTLYKYFSTVYDDHHEKCCEGYRLWHAVTPYQFQDATSIWKWREGDWLVFLPGKDDNGEEYATTKGFGMIAQINPGEGFWVNQ